MTAFVRSDPHDMVNNDEEGEEGRSKEQPVKDGDGTVEAEGNVKAEPGTKLQARRHTREEEYHRLNSTYALFNS